MIFINACIWPSGIRHVEFKGDMLMCDYLREVLYPAAKCEAICRLNKCKTTVSYGLFFVRAEHAVTGKTEHFDYANRLRRVDEVLRDGGTIGFAGDYHDTRNRLWGNATRLDAREACTVCFLPENGDDVDHATNFVLPCKHMFHAGCLRCLMQETCPLCRAPISEDKMLEINVMCIDDVHNGHMEPIQRGGPPLPPMRVAPSPQPAETWGVRILIDLSQE